MNMFIPPEGAMQFEFNPTLIAAMGFPDYISGLSYAKQLVYVWVKEDGRICPKRHKLYKPFLDGRPEVKHFLPGVCGCGGRIIE